MVAGAELGWYSGDAPTAADAGGPGDGSTTATLERAVPGLGAAPRTMAMELDHSVPLSPLERLVPRSVRPSWWRD